MKLDYLLELMVVEITGIKLSSVYPQYTIKANKSDFTFNLGNLLET